MLRWPASTAAAATVTGLVVTLAASSPPQAAREGIVMLTAGGRATANPSSGIFTVQGQSVTGLYPGVVRDMTLTLTNPYSFDLRVTGLEGKVRASSRRKCTPGDSTVTAKTYSGKLPVTLRANSRRTVGSIPIAMAGSAPTSCSSTTFTILLIGHATKARQ